MGIKGLATPKFQEGTLNCTRPPPPKCENKQSLIYNTYLSVTGCNADQNLLIVANMQAYNSETKIHSFQANAFLSWRRAENDSYSVCRHVYNQEISHNIYLPISSLYPMSATIECVIQVVSWLDCINYTPPYLDLN
jgi:hypothetical protein